MSPLKDVRHLNKVMLWLLDWKFWGCDRMGCVL